MDSFDDDMFALSDEDLPIPVPKCNPVEEHLIKQLSDVHTRIEKTTNDIKEIENTTERILKSLQHQAQYGENITSDSDSDLYSIDGQPLVKMKKQEVSKHNQILIVQTNWIRIISDKWVIGIVLQNTSNETLCNLQFYVALKDVDAITGISTFWSLMDDTFWHQIDTIEPRGKAMATVVLDLPMFDKDSFCDAYGTVSYEVDEKQYQAPVSTIRLHVEETINNCCGLKFSNDVEQTILAIKSISIEKLVGIQIEGNPGRGERLLSFLKEKSFKEICSDVYSMKSTGCLMYCLVEILPIVEGAARLRIFARSCSEMNIVLRLLQDQFPDMIVQEDDINITAAMALLEELKSYLEDSSDSEQQTARIKTDLLIS
ncbi:golgi SNAP receptor complex member Gos28 isoform X1 [Calliopsis andreniformis]|uniref:golgi SNAP receptor complex member Gos28 isoform X1 n=1 Tax=Calliopsis andreniformis TaxID=337506 RepID=UPI003FCECD6F